MRHSLILLTLLSCITQFSCALKILIFVPTMSRSNGLFNARVGDLLAKHGHQVTLYAPKQDRSVNMSKLSKNCTVLDVPGVDEAEFDHVHAHMDKQIFTDMSLMDSSSRELFENFTRIMYKSCETQVKNTAVLEKLKAEKFDVAFSHMYDFCPFGLIDMLEIPATVWMCSTGVIVEQMAAAAGVTSPPSFVPSTMSAFSDRMSFQERFLNFLGNAIFAPFIFAKMNSMTTIFREHVRADFPELMTLAGDKAQLLFINGIELLDFPRPILHKVIYMGGIGMKAPNDLDKTWDATMATGRDGVVLISFGSVANPALMPSTWKDVIIGLAARMPTYTFLWKYDGDDVADEKLFGRLPSNLHLSKWMPQTDILGDSRLRAFITHGGYNSLLESAYAGAPLVIVPLLGEQFRNGRVAERHGFGVTVQKSEFDTATLEKQLKTVLNEKNYLNNAKQMSRMLKKRPVSSEELVIKWTEFLAEFQSLPNLDVAARTMTTIELHNLDVLGVLAGAVFLVIFILFKVLFFCVSLLCCGSAKTSGKKSKRE